MRADAEHPLVRKATLGLDVAPAARLAGPTRIEVGRPYTLLWNLSDPGNDAVTGLAIDWGDGQVVPVTPGSTVPTVAAVYTLPSILNMMFMLPTSSTYFFSTPSSHSTCA